ncbi:MAG: type II toxin-antitoxin system VapC family toxin [Deltaproteobacteria bacterium]|nr:type II toxin-antitoxin system VapC family toxin [Deltaproteobacteria bacterium]MBW2530415.1 type II toxin-antitoxin system VapC family toxin [Deltaproteobacteria bacterium]
MNRVLLDTHAFLWFVFDDPRLSARAEATMSDPRITKLLGVASLWEIVIKHQLGKLGLGMEVQTFFDRFIHREGLEIVPIEPSHLVAYAQLPLHHRDPFDRLLVAQAKVLDMPIVTSDQSFEHYDVESLW